MKTFVVALALSSMALAAPASAQWSRVTEIPATPVFSVWSNGDTIVAGADTVAFVSTDAGAHWLSSARPVAGVASIEAVRIRNGRLYAGTSGLGVRVSDDLGDTWQDFNQGLTGGFLDSQLFISDFEVRGDSLYAATAGAGVYVRGLSGPGTWHPFGGAFESNQASNVNCLGLGGTRLLAAAGGNGMVLIRDPGDADWTVSDLDNVGIRSGLQAQSAAWTGTGWVVGCNLGVFRSVAGQEPWTPSGPGLGILSWTAFATQEGHLFAAFDTPPGVVLLDSGDDGATWQNAESLAGVFVEAMAINGNRLYAARRDGLWRRATGTVSVAIDRRPEGPRFAVAGPQPFREQARLRFVLPVAGPASIQIMDILGRATGGRIDGYWPAGPHEVSLDAGRLSPGVYVALLRAHGTHEAVRLVHVR